MAGQSEIDDVTLQRLSAMDQRYTGNRRLVVRALAEADAPMTIAALLEVEAELAQSSTYRNLAVLEEAGIVHRIVTTDDHARFELTEDVTGTHHHHLVCTTCGDVLDVTLPDDLEEELHTALTEAASTSDFDGAHHRIDVIGTCRSCR